MRILLKICLIQTHKTAKRPSNRKRSKPVTIVTATHKMATAGELGGSTSTFSRDLSSSISLSHRVSIAHYWVIFCKAVVPIYLSHSFPQNGLPYTKITPKATQYTLVFELAAAEEAATGLDGGWTVGWIAVGGLPDDKGPRWCTFGGKVGPVAAAVCSAAAWPPTGLDPSGRGNSDPYAPASSGNNEANWKKIPKFLLC